MDSGEIVTFAVLEDEDVMVTLAGGSRLNATITKSVFPSKRSIMGGLTDP